MRFPIFDAGAFTVWRETTALNIGRLDALRKRYHSSWHALIFSAPA